MVLVAIRRLMENIYIFLKVCRWFPVLCHICAFSPVIALCRFVLINCYFVPTNEPLILCCFHSIPSVAGNYQ